jgi:SNF2 family DNA or RNA helicase
MGEEQRLYYEEAKMQIRDSLFLDIKNEGLSKARFNIIQGLQRLRQICNAPQLIKDTSIAVCTESIKIDYLLEKLTGVKEEGAKALVFSQFTGMLNLIAEACQEREIDFYHFDGSTPTAQRHEMVRNFQSEGDDKTAFLISLKAGNAGLNLTAAQYVFLVDPWWNNAVEQQAIDRTHRIGQQSQVFAYRMICKDTVEEKILAIQQKKKRLSDELISAEEGFVKQITEDELQYLFS